VPAACRLIEHFAAQHVLPCYALAARRTRIDTRLELIGGRWLGAARQTVFAQFGSDVRRFRLVFATALGDELVDVRWAIFGTGGISAKFVSGLQHAQGATAQLVVSRGAETGARFAKAFGIPDVAQGYESVTAASPFDVAYIATPPSEHARHAIACIEAGKAVLIEKPFASSVEEARRIADAARAQGVFCMEAMWTRFNPAARRLRDLVREGAIGEVRQAHGEFCFTNEPDPASTSFDPQRGGGALAQLGVYPISLMHWLFGAPEAIEAFGRIGETGVEEDVAISLRFAGGVVATVNTSLRALGGNGLRVAGTHGSVAFEGPIFRPYGVRLERMTPRRRAGGSGLGRKALLREQGLPQKLSQLHGLLTRGGKVQRRLFAGNGYHYQVEEVGRCLAAGLHESPEMTLNDSIAVMESMDKVRDLIGSGGQR
jgi:predicted dehydrogenase